MPSVLYKIGDNHTVYRMSEVFVPPKDPKDPHRVNMIRYNQKIMFAELAKKLPHEKVSQRRERRRDIKLREKQGIKATEQHMRSESAIQSAIADYTYLKTYGRKQRKLEAYVEKILPTRTKKPTETVHKPISAKKIKNTLE